MHALFSRNARFCPRRATLVVLFLIAALLALANLSEESRTRALAAVPLDPADFCFDVREREDWAEWATADGVAMNLSYGWPLLWNQYIVASGFGQPVIGWRFSAARVAGDVAMWLAMLAVPASLCEWISRRRALRMRFSLRTMLAAWVLMAGALGWFASARDRAEVEDALVDAIEKRDGRVLFERWGPKWLDLVGADRYRRSIAAVELRVSAFNPYRPADPPAQPILEKLARRPNLKQLFLTILDPAPDLMLPLRDFRQLRTLYINMYPASRGTMAPSTIQAFAEALRGMSRLRDLRIEPCAENDDESKRWMAAIGQAVQIEHLQLSNMKADDESLFLLAGLVRLKTLSFDRIFSEIPEAHAAPPLHRLPAFPRLEALNLQGHIGDDDLLCLARLPHLRLLRLSCTQVTETGLSCLASLEALEELSLYGCPRSASGFESLLALEHLKRLHVCVRRTEPHSPRAAPELMPDVPPEELDRSLAILRSLRQKNPGIVIDGDYDGDLRWHAHVASLEYDTRERRRGSHARELLAQWKKAGCPRYAP